MSALLDIAQFFRGRDFKPPEKVRTMPMKVRTTYQKRVTPRFKVIGETSAQGKSEGSAKIVLEDRNTVVSMKRYGGTTVNQLFDECARLVEIVRRLPKDILNRDIQDAIKALQAGMPIREV